MAQEYVYGLTEWEVDYSTNEATVYFLALMTSTGVPLVGRLLFFENVEQCAFVDDKNILNIQFTLDEFPAILGILISGKKVYLHFDSEREIKGGEDDHKGFELSNAYLRIGSVYEKDWKLFKER